MKYIDEHKNDYDDMSYYGMITAINNIIGPGCNGMSGNASSAEMIYPNSEHHRETREATANGTYIQALNGMAMGKLLSAIITACPIIEKFISLPVSDGPDDPPTKNSTNLPSGRIKDERVVLDYMGIKVSYFVITKDNDPSAVVITTDQYGNYKSTSYGYGPIITATVGADGSLKLGGLGSNVGFDKNFNIIMDGAVPTGTTSRAGVSVKISSDFIESLFQSAVSMEFLDYCLILIAL